MPDNRSARNAEKAPAAKPAPKQAPPQVAGPAPAPRGLADLLADPLQATPAQLAQLQRQYGNAAVQRLIQRAQAPDAPDQPVGPEGGELDPGLQDQINAARGSGQSLDPDVGGKVGAALGADLSGVRVHTDTQAGGLNRSLGAEAFTLGSDVFFSEGAYDPHSTDGQHLLAHELTHVVQQGSAPAAIQTKRSEDTGQGVVEDEEDLSGAFQQLFGQEEENQGPEEEDEEDLSGAFQQLFGEEEETEEQGPEEEDDEDLSEAFHQLFGEEEDTGGGTPSTPSVAAPPQFSWAAPAIPPILTVADWNKNKSRWGKITKATGLSELLNIIAVMHRGVQWDRFNAAAVIKTDFTPEQKAAAAQLQQGGEEDTFSSGKNTELEAELSLAKAQLALAKANAQQAEGALKLAQQEKQSRVTRFLMQVNELVTLIQMSAGKLKGDAAHLGQMLTAAQRLQSQVENVNSAVSEIQRRTEPLKTAEVQATAKVEETKQRLKAAGVEVLDDELDLDLDEEEVTDEEETEELVPVTQVIAPAWFSQLGNVKFATEADVQAWADSDELRLSARDNKPDSDLRRMQDDARRAAEQFADLRQQMNRLRDKELNRDDAIKEVKLLWAKLRAVFDQPQPRTPNIVFAHRGWESRQLNLAGGNRRKLEEWMKSHPGAARAHQRLEQILREDRNIIVAREQELKRIQ